MYSLYNAQITFHLFTPSLNLKPHMHLKYFISHTSEQFLSETPKVQVSDSHIIAWIITSYSVLIP